MADSKRKKHGLKAHNQRPRLGVATYAALGDRIMQQRQNMALGGIALAIVTLIAVIIGASSLFKLEPQRYVIPVDPAGIPLSEYRLSQPLYKDDEILRWTKHCLANMFDLAYATKRDSLAYSRTFCLSPKGFDEFVEQLTNAGFLPWLKKPARFFALQIDRIKIDKKGLAGKRFAWRVSADARLLRVNKKDLDTFPYHIIIDIKRASKMAHDIAIRITRIRAISQEK